MPNYKSIHQVRNYSNGGGVSICINKSLNFKLRPDLRINSRDVESLSIEILFNKERNAILHLVDQINCSFEKNLFALAIFIDLSKAFDSRP